MEVGDRIQLIIMPDDPDPIPPGTQGTIVEIVSLHMGIPRQVQVEVDWDIKRSLALVIPPDRIKVLVQGEPQERT